MAATIARTDSALSTSELLPEDDNELLLRDGVGGDGGASIGGSGGDGVSAQDASEDSPGAASAVSNKPVGVLNETLSAKFVLYVCLFQSVTISGLVWGWPTMELLLQSNGIYSSLCDEPNKHHDPERMCGARTVRFNAIFQCGALAGMGAGLLLGWLIDRHGARFGSQMGHALNVAGLLCMAMGFVGAYPLLFVGYMLLGFGGSVVHLTNFQVANLFGARKAYATSVIVGMFALSGLITMIYYALFRGLGVAVTAIFLTHACLESFNAFVAYRVFPAHTIMPGDTCQLTSWRTLRVVHYRAVTTPVTPAPAPTSPSTTSTKETELSTMPHVTVDTKADTAEGVVTDVPMTQRTLMQQMKSREMIILMTYYAIHNLENRFYLATARDRLVQLGDEQYNYGFTLAFTIIGPFAVLFSPLYGYVFKRYGHAGLSTVQNTAVVVYLVIALIDNLQIQLLGFVFWAMSRQFMFSSFFAFVGSVFGFKHFARVSGIGSVPAALMTPLQYPMLTIVYDVNGGDYTVMLVVLLLLALPLYTFAVFAKNLRWLRGSA